MPNKLKKPCSNPRCLKLTQVGEQYCIQHKKEERKKFDKQRGTAAQRGYNARWRSYRKRYLLNHPLCVNFEECHNAATVVYHKVPVSKGGSFWAPNNHQPMCESCHNRKTAKEDGRWGDVNLYTFSPPDRMGMTCPPKTGPNVMLGSERKILKRRQVIGIRFRSTSHLRIGDFYEKIMQPLFYSLILLSVAATHSAHIVLFETESLNLTLSSSGCSLYP